MVIRDIPLRAFNERIYSHAILKFKIQAIISNQIDYLKSYLVELPDKEVSMPYGFSPWSSLLSYRLQGYSFYPESTTPKGKPGFFFLLI
jgi:hypothetical protein